MTADAVGAVVLTVIMSACGLGIVWVGRAGASRRIDWSWGGHTAGNTPSDLWDDAHRQAGPPMVSSGWLMVLSGLLGGSLLLINEAWGLTALLGLIVASLAMMFRSIGIGLRVLSDRDR